jgi:hypothetical protein
MNNQFIEHMKLQLVDLEKEREWTVSTAGDESVDWEFISGQIHAIENLLLVAEGYFD